MGTEVTKCTRTLRLKVKSEAYGWLNAAAVEVNQVWNFANATSYKAARPFSGPAKGLSAYDRDKLAAGATEYFERIGADTIQRVNAEFAGRRRQFKEAKLRWRVSRGSRRSLGWMPFKAVQLKRKGKSLRLSGKVFRVFERDRLEGVQWKSGCFAQDAVGDWWLRVADDLAVAQAAARDEAVGLDLGLKSVVATSDREKHWDLRLPQINFKQVLRRPIEPKYQMIVVGDVSAPKLAKTRMAKSVLDSGWGMLKAQLQYKGQEVGRCVRIVSERYTTQACSGCGALTGPAGLDMLAVRTWMCGGCGAPTTGTSMLRETSCPRGGVPRPSVGTSSLLHQRRRARQIADASQGKAR